MKRYGWNFVVYRLPVSSEKTTLEKIIEGYETFSKGLRQKSRVQRDIETLKNLTSVDVKFGFCIRQYTGHSAIPGSVLVKGQGKCEKVFISEAIQW